jgi:tRNA threonylcarbamoyl adenosine modification protein (Sua5/YciO/YrdC/YwlC family)
MTQFFQIHSENPQPRLANQAVSIIRKGGVIVYPTDSGYALGCQLGDKTALNRIKLLRRLDDRHHMTLVCRDLSELANYARVDNSAYRLIKNHTPGHYTFILRATSEVPRRLQHPKKKTIGLRVPENNIALAILDALGEPLMSTTLILPGKKEIMTDPYDIRIELEGQVDLIVDGGYCGNEETSMIDLTSGTPEIVRIGQGDVNAFI